MSKTNIQKIAFFFGSFLLFCMTAFAQSTTVSGTVKNSETKETLSAVSVLIKGSSIGAYTDDRGFFKFATAQKPPFTLVVSSIGYSPKEIEFTGTDLAVNLEPSYALGQEIVIAASRLPERILESPVSIERVNAATIRNAPGANYYDALGNLKGVDVTTSSYTFKTVSTRGFNGSGNLRFNQLVDGMDNAAPALNFSVGNVIGVTELDVDNMELLSGASSALYGSGGLNGTLLITSKDPFKYQGLSVLIKQGAIHLNDYRHATSPFYDWSLRWGKKVSDKFAFKIGASYSKTDDWQANDTTDLLRNNVLSQIKPGDRQSDPNYDGVNVYGDEASASMQDIALAGIFGPSNPTLNTVIGILGTQLGHAPTQQDIIGYYAMHPEYGVLNVFGAGIANNVFGGQLVSRTGYAEKDLVDYNSFNLKLSGGLYFKITPTIEASLSGNWGLGNSVYTGSDRYTLKNFNIGQYKLEFKSANWFFRAYTTQENSGDSYASTLASLYVNNAWKDNGTWFGQYTANYAGAVLQGASPTDAHGIARGQADLGRYMPGTPEYIAAFNKAITTSINDGGAQFADKSDLYQVEGQWNFKQYIKFIDVLVGASYRLYNINSQGTIFADTAGPIKINEFGAYIQLQKELFNNVLKLSASGRFDKQDNFKGNFTPRVTASIKVAKDNFFRLSYQQAYRFPSNQDQYINLTTPGTKLIGGLPQFGTFYNFATNPVYTAESVVAFRNSVAAGVPNPGLLVKADFVTVQPEKMESYEVGYRGIIGKKLLVDAYYYFSKYNNFILRSAVARGIDNDPATSISQLSSPFTTQNFSFVTNSKSAVNTNGWGVSLEYKLGMKGYRIMGNVYGDDISGVPDNGVAFFNTPKTRFNLGLSNDDAYKGLGFNVIYKWQDKVSWEGTFGTGEIPSFGTLDAQVSYKLNIGTSKNQIKLGATNLLNKYYRNAFGNPYVGGLYYISFGYNVF
ncbi:MAG: TonB-dependent receptor [Chitinophagaceae bacterium]